MRTIILFFNYHITITTIFTTKTNRNTRQINSMGLSVCYKTSTLVISTVNPLNTDFRPTGKKFLKFLQDTHLPVVEQNNSYYIQNNSILYLFPNRPIYTEFTTVDSHRKLHQNLLLIFYRKTKSWLFVKELIMIVTKKYLHSFLTVVKCFYSYRHH